MSEASFGYTCLERVAKERQDRAALGKPAPTKDEIAAIIDQLYTDALKHANYKRSKADSSQFGDPRDIPPPPALVSAYSASIGYPLDGPAWCDHYEEKGWAVGKAGKRMRNWQCAVRNWKTNKWGLGSVAIGTAKPAANSNRPLTTMR